MQPNLEHKAKVIVAEQNNQMYGGTCINIGCLPSKSLILDAERAHFSGESTDPDKRKHLDPALMVICVACGSNTITLMYDGGFLLFKETFGISMKDTSRHGAYLSLLTLLLVCLPYLPLISLSN